MIVQLFVLCQRCFSSPLIRCDVVNMVKFLLKTFIDNIIACILFLSIFSLFESSYPWGTLGKDCSNGFLMEQGTVTCTDAEEFQYWDDLDENSKTEIIKSIDVDKNIMKLYLHKIKLSDNNMSATILDTLSSSTDGYKRMLHFYILNEIVNTADGAVAEMVSGYCVKYVNENTDYALEYFSKHQDVAINYVYIIAGELYLSDTSFTQYEQLLFDSAKSKCAKEYLPTFLKEIKRILAKINL